MTFIMLYATERNALKTVRNWYKRHPEFFVGRFGNKVFLLRNTGEILAYATKLMLKHKGFVELFVVEQLDLRDIPEKVRRVAEWMENQPEIGLKKAIKHTEIQDLNELRQIKLHYYKSLNEKSSKRSRQRDFAGLIYTSQEKEKGNSTD